MGMFKWLAAILIMVLLAPCAYAQDCSQEPQLRSPAGGAPTSIEFRNGGDRERHIYWLDESGHRKPYAVVAPKGTLTQSTFVSHIWVVTGPLDHCMTIVTATQALLTVDVTNPAASRSAPVTVAPATASTPPPAPSKPVADAPVKCGAQEVFSSRMGRCVPKSVTCRSDQVYSSSLRQCISKDLTCPPNQIYNVQLKTCSSTCPYGLAKVCKNGVCRCTS
jgi:hypothetical protein